MASHFSVAVSPLRTVFTTNFSSKRAGTRKRNSCQATCFGESNKILMHTLKKLKHGDLNENQNQNKW